MTNPVLIDCSLAQPKPRVCTTWANEPRLHINKARAEGSRVVANNHCDLRRGCYARVRFVREDLVDTKGPPGRDSVVTNEETEKVGVGCAGGLNGELGRSQGVDVGPRESGCGPRRWFR